MRKNDGLALESLIKQWIGTSYGKSCWYAPGANSIQCSSGPYCVIIELQKRQIAIPLAWMRLLSVLFNCYTLARINSLAAHAATSAEARLLWSVSFV